MNLEKHSHLYSDEFYLKKHWGFVLKEITETSQIHSTKSYYKYRGIMNRYAKNDQQTTTYFQRWRIKFY